MARGVRAIRVVDDGTIVPTAAGGSVAFAPEVAIPALMAMRTQYVPRLYTRYGFKDALNPSFTFSALGSKSGAVDPVPGRVANDTLGINQGPIPAILDNPRTVRDRTHVGEGNSGSVRVYLSDRSLI